jgi:signal transduction histidine kinase
MSKVQRKNSAENKRARKMRRAERFYRAQRSTSIYFLLWTVFTVLSLVIVLSISLSQQFVLTQTYKGQASREVTEKGEKIEREILNGAPEWAGGNFSGYVRMLSLVHNVQLYILDENGAVLFPQEPNFNPDAPEVQEQYDFTEWMPTLLKNLSNAKEGYTVYEGNGAYVYATKLELYKDVDSYLYVGKSLDLMETVSARMKARVALSSVFVFVLSFAVTSAVAGWLSNPITEMTKKARRLAQGNFDVDFRGEIYGKELVELAEALNFARDELSKTDRMQKELIANVSHDFKTPLTMIKGYASMIMEISGDIPEKRNKHAQVIVDEADRLTSLVSDVLDLSKITSGIEELKLTVFDMSAYLDEVLARFDYLKETKGYRFVTEIEDNLYTRGDEVKLGQALYNLIGNAVNYTGDDNTVYVRLKKENGKWVRFSVTDTGKGIKAEELSEIWNRYYRSSETHKRPVRGTGLGLSIVKTILERHGFVFGVESEVGKGSTFYVLFPLVDEENA